MRADFFQINHAMHAAHQCGGSPEDVVTTVSTTVAPPGAPHALLPAEDQRESLVSKFTLS